jgi:hypothetical protein
VEQPVAQHSAWRWYSQWCWHIVISPPIKVPAALAFLHTAPLLEEEQASLLLTLHLDRADPCWFHWSGTGTAFAADDHPVNACKVEWSEILEERLDA